VKAASATAAAMRPPNASGGLAPAVGRVGTVRLELPAERAAAAPPNPGIWETVRPVACTARCSEASGSGDVNNKATTRRATSTLEGERGERHASCGVADHGRLRRPAGAGHSAQKFPAVARIVHLHLVIERQERREARGPGGGGPAQQGTAALRAPRRLRAAPPPDPSGLAVQSVGKYG
jgi:hypothetical protein